MQACRPEFRSQDFPQKAGHSRVSVTQCYAGTMLIWWETLYQRWNVEIDREEHLIFTSGLCMHVGTRWYTCTDLWKTPHRSDSYSHRHIFNVLITPCKHPHYTLKMEGCRLGWVLGPVFVALKRGICPKKGAALLPSLCPTCAWSFCHTLWRPCLAPAWLYAPSYLKGIW